MCRPFATRSEDHDHHMTVFPSLKPAGRHEVIALKVPTCTSNPSMATSPIHYSHIILDETLVLYIIMSVSTCLQHTLDAMLERAGVASNLKDSDLKGPTEVGEREGERGGGEGGREGETKSMF